MFQVGQPDEQSFRPSPIDPTWILEGNPVARSMPLVVSDDSLLTCGQWDCTAGRFKFVYFCDEIIQISEGSATIEMNGRTRTLNSGDVVLFPEGTTAIWTVHGYVKKLAVFRSKRRGLISRIARKIEKLAQTVFRPPTR